MQYKRYLLKNKSVYLSWLLSYVLILFIPVLISGLLFRESGAVMKGEINRANMQLLRQVQQDLDSKLHEIEALSLQIALNESMQGLVHLRGEVQNYHRYAMRMVISDLKAYMAAQNLSNYFYIYFKNQNFILTKDGLFTPEDFYNTMHKSDKLPYEQWHEIISSEPVKGYASLDTRSGSGALKKSIAYMRALPMDSPGRQNATVVILVEEEHFNNYLQGIKWVGEGTAYVLGRNGEVVTSTGSANLDNLPEFTEPDDKEPLRLTDSTGEEAVVNCMASEVTDWKYVFVIPSRVFWEKSKYITRLSGVCVILYLLIGGYVTYLFSKKHYSSINQIVSAIAGKAGLSLNEKHNEYEFIKKALMEVYDRKEQVEKVLKNQNRMLRSSFLSRLIKGRLDRGINADDMAAEYDIGFISDSFAVMVFYLEDFNDYFPEQESMTPGESMHLVQLILANVFEELFNEKNRGYVIELDNMLTCLVNFSDSQAPSAKEEMRQISEKAREFVQEELHIYFSIAASSIHQTITEIPQAYQEALEAMEYKKVLGNNQMIEFETIKISADKNYHNAYSLATQQKIINCIKAGDFENAKEIINRIFQDHFTSPTLSIEMVKCLMFAMVNTMLNAMAEISIYCEETFLKELNPIGRLLHCETAVEMKYHINDILMKVGEYIEMKKKDENNRRIKNILDYIENHYPDVNLSVATLADRFDLNPAYLSRFFKDYTGERLLDCMNRIRLQKAKLLLENGKININEIATRVGYYNSNAFIRTFRKYEGVTPGKYRELTHHM